MANKYLTVNIAVKNRPVLVVGGGGVALRKVETLLDYDADITVVAPQIEDKLAFHEEKGRIKIEKREYKEGDTSGFKLVISASNDDYVNQQVYKECQKANIPVNVVDNPPLCDFTFPAVLKRDCLTVSVSTDGQAPYLASFLRLILEDIFPKRWSTVAKLAADFRKMVQKKYPDDAQQRNLCFDRFLKSDWKNLVNNHSPEELQEDLKKVLEGEILAVSREDDD